MPDRVLIIVPPFSSIEFPSLEAACLTAACRNAGQTVDLYYLSHEFSALVGERVYQDIASLPPPSGIPDWVGAGPMNRNFPPEVISARRYLTFDDYMSSEMHLRKAEANELHAIKRLIPIFQRRVISNIEWAKYKLIFMCCRHNQLGFSLSFIQAVKGSASQLAPILLFGGHLADEDQARAFLAACPELSGVVIQSAPSTTAMNLDRLREGHSVPGVVQRHLEAYADAAAKSSRGTLDVFPDYDDYYNRYALDPALSLLPFQASQGCAWADSGACTFCGLIPPGQRFITRPTTEFVEGVERLCNSYETLHVVTADHMISQRYGREAFPLLASRPHDITFFFEIRSNLSKEMLTQLWDGGVTHVEVGIESFDTSQLKEMRKGSDCLRNIAVLKWLNERGFIVYWSFLYGFKSEDDFSLSLQIELMKKLTHFQPPLHAARVRLDRYSTMFSDPEQHGVRDIKPVEAYLHTYPLNMNQLGDLAKFFDYTGAAMISEDVVNQLQTLVKAWKATWRPGLLYFRRGPSFIKIFDNRGSEASITTLRDWEADMYRCMDGPVSESDLSRLIAASGYDREVNQLEISATLNRLESEKLIVRERGRALALAPHLSQDMLNFLRMQKMFAA